MVNLGSDQPFYRLRQDCCILCATLPKWDLQDKNVGVGLRIWCYKYAQINIMDKVGHPITTPWTIFQISNLMCKLQQITNRFLFLF